MWFSHHCCSDLSHCCCRSSHLSWSYWLFSKLLFCNGSWKQVEPLENLTFEFVVCSFFIIATIVSLRPLLNISLIKYLTPSYNAIVPITLVVVETIWAIWAGICRMKKEINKKTTLKFIIYSPFLLMVD